MTVPGVRAFATYVTVWVVKTLYRLQIVAARYWWRCLATYVGSGVEHLGFLFVDIYLLVNIY